MITKQKTMDAFVSKLNNDVRTFVNDQINSVRNGNVYKHYNKARNTFVYVVYAEDKNFYDKSYFYMYFKSAAIVGNGEIYGQRTLSIDELEEFFVDIRIAEIIEIGGAK